MFLKRKINQEELSTSPTKDGGIFYTNKMKSKLQIYYDEEGDFLELHMKEYTHGYFKNLGKGIFERVDEKTGKITGVAILGFKKRTKDLKEVKIDLPLDMQLLA
jgi:hypothetical protein